MPPEFVLKEGIIVKKVASSEGAFQEEQRSGGFLCQHVLGVAIRILMNLPHDQCLVRFRIWEPYAPTVFFRQFLPVSPKVQFNVVVSAFFLSELPGKADHAEVVQALWCKTSDFLILVESGAKAGHCLLMEARDLVLKGKEKSPLDPRPGFVFAPCPHEHHCPQLTASKPLACSFSQAYHPIPFSWNKKPKEEKFSVVILARGSPEEDTRWPRITQPVLKRPCHVHCPLCCPDGHMQLAVITAQQHGRDLYHCAHVSSWGDLLPVTTPSELPSSPAKDPSES